VVEAQEPFLAQKLVHGFRTWHLLLFSKEAMSLNYSMSSLVHRQ